MSDPVVGLRRTAPPGPDDVEGDPELLERIRAEIAEHGPIPFARFMERALYEPGHGYYRRPEPGPGRAGDFLTAPEAHPLFGAAIGRLVEEAWTLVGRPDPFVLTEPGAGVGALALGLLDGLRRSGSPLLAAIRYRPVEIEPARLAVVERRLADAGFADRLRLDAPAEPEDGAVVANEVADALPVHRVVRRGRRLRERYVTWTDGRLVEVEGEPSTAALAERLEAGSIDLPDGVVAEVCLALDGWVAEQAARIRRGLLVVVDYGEDADTLYGPHRHEGTLRGFVRHSVTGEVLARVGRQDLTAHVDLSALRRAAAATGLAPLGETTQAELLAAVDRGDLVRQALDRPEATLEDALALRFALVRLMDPRGMGGFRVLVFGRGFPDGVRLRALERAARPGVG